MSKRKNVWTRSSSNDSAELDARPLNTKSANGASDSVKRPYSISWQRPGPTIKPQEQEFGSRGTGSHTGRMANFQAAQVPGSSTGAPSARHSPQVRTGVGPGLQSTGDVNGLQRWNLPLKWSQQHNMARSCTAAVLAAAAAKEGPAAGLVPAPEGSKSNSAAATVSMQQAELVGFVSSNPSFAGQKGHRSSACRKPELQLLSVPQRAAVAAAAGVSLLPTSYAGSHRLTSPTRTVEQKWSNVWVRHQPGKVATPPLQLYSQPVTAVGIGAVVGNQRRASQPQAATKRRAKTWMRGIGADGSGRVQQSSSITFVRRVGPVPTGRRLSSAAMCYSKSPASRSTSISMLYRKPASGATSLRSSASIQPTGVRSSSWKKARSGKPALPAGASSRGEADATSAPRSCTTIQVQRVSRCWSLRGARTGSGASRLSRGHTIKVWTRQPLPDQSAMLQMPSTKAAFKQRGSSPRYWRFRGVAGATRSPATAFVRSGARVPPYNSLASTSGAARREHSSKKSAGSPIIFCPLFCQSGVCKKRSTGTCKYCHDASKVAVCPAWLGDHCTVDRCPLQHAHVPALMPVCTFFLQGACSKADCPYLHVNLDPAAPVCESFLNGYCAAGASCRAKHLTLHMMRDPGAKRTLTNGARESRSKRFRALTKADIAARAVPKIAQRPVVEPEILDLKEEPRTEMKARVDYGVAQSPWGEFVAIPEEYD